MTVRDAAQFLRISERYLYSLVRHNAIPHFRVGSQIRFNRGELIRMSLNELVAEEWVATRRVNK